MNRKSDRIVYIELLRILATMAVIMIHVTAIMIGNNEIGTVSWNISVVYNSLTRWCIPLFFMISGCCFLNREGELSVKEIIKKYVLRLLVVLIIFGLFYCFFDLWIYNETIDFKQILLAPFNVLSGHTGYHLWYLYDMILIYFMIPILQKIVKHTDKKLLEYCLLIYVIFELLVTYFNSLVKYMPVLSEVLEINFEFPDLLGYIGCFMGGYYISHYELSKRVRNLVYVVGGVGLLIMPLGNWILSKIQGIYISVFADYNGLFSVMLAVTLFILLKSKEEHIKESKFAGWIANLGRSTFGIYLVHVMIVSIVFHKLPIDLLKYNSTLTIVALTIFVFIISYILVYVIKKIPILKKYI